MCGLYFESDELKLLKFMDVQNIAVRDGEEGGLSRVLIPAGILANIRALSKPIRDFLQITYAAEALHALWATVVASRLHIALQVLKDARRRIITLSDILGPYLEVIRDSGGIFEEPLEIPSNIGEKYLKMRISLFSSAGMRRIVPVNANIDALLAGEDEWAADIMRIIVGSFENV